MKLNLSNCSGFDTHRSGWSYCINSLRPYHSNNGLYIDDFIERSFSWHLNEYYIEQNKYKIPYKRDWAGFLHNPPNSPLWFDTYNNPSSIFKRDVFKQSLKTCRAIIVLSDYLKHWADDNLPIKVPVISVKHPTEIPAVKWNYRKFLRNKKRQVVQIGYWLRKFDSICQLKVPNVYYKSWLPSDMKTVEILTHNFEAQQEKTWAECKIKWANTSILNRLSNIEYDDLMSSCIAFCDFYDSSANNAIIECIARSTPILVNRIAAVEEYLGPNYPFYFSSIDECFDKLADNRQILDCHEYLMNMNKDWITGDFFAVDLIRKLKLVM